MTSMTTQQSQVVKARTSADDAYERFNTAGAAAKYTGGLTDTPSHQREIRCLKRALRTLPRGSRVLDLPCGTGRLLPPLTEMGLVVTEADASPHMIEQARTFATARGVQVPDDRFVVASVFETGFSADEFDATVCNRLFHHFHEPKVRQDGLRELRRITRGPIVVSFFTARSLLGQVFRVRNRLRGRRHTDRVPIMPGTFAEDARAAGLAVVDWYATRPGVSKQCYAVLMRA
jgi:ubiquinone/menaquinone biosynthesis C-methylase UbiE